MALVSTAVKAQSGFEYLSTYTWALLIITIVLGLFYFFTILPNTIAPNYCSFPAYISCKDFMAGTTNGITTIAFVMGNMQQ